jgi:glutathione-regulated potassium-efflux system ancillary protein KefG
VSDRVIPQRVLVLFAHPALEKSRVNRVLIDGLDSMEGITFHDLYEAYPGLDIDVAREQALLTDHDVIVMHHPFFWYSTPAILKEWQDLVLQHGWAYGTDGNALRGKFLMSAVTTGGKEDAYEEDGFHGCRVRDFLLPIARTAWLCGVTYLAPFIAHGTLHMTRERMAEHAADYRRLLQALREGAVDLTKAADPDLAYVNRDLSSVLPEATDAR